MFPSGGRVVSQASRQLRLRQPRRLASDSISNGEAALHVPPGPGSESFSKGFYITLSLIPLGIVGSILATSSETGPRFTRFIQSFQESEEEIDRRNTLHQAATAQAARDRHLFATAPAAASGIELRFPEALNRSSPWNVVAGEGGADLTKLMEHYTQENERVEAARLAKVKEGTVKTVYDDTTGGRIPSWVPLIGSSKKTAPGFRE